MENQEHLFDMDEFKTPEKENAIKTANSVEVETVEYTRVFPELTRDETDVLLMAATKISAVPMTNVAMDLPKTGLKTEHNRRFSKDGVQVALKHLVHFGYLVDKTGRRMVPDRETRLRIFRETFDHAEYRQRAISIAQWAVAQPAGYIYFTEDKIRNKQMKLELFVMLGRYEEAVDLALTDEYYDEYDNPEQIPLDFDFIFSCLSEDELKKVPDVLLFHGAFDFLAFHSFELRPLTPLEFVLTKPNIPINILAPLGTYYFLQGEEKKVQTIVKALRSEASKYDDDDLIPRTAYADADSLEACLTFAKGDIDQAIEGFEESIQKEKGKSKKRKFAPRWIGGLLHVLSLCRRGTPKDLTRAIQISQWNIELDESTYSGLSNIGVSIAKLLSGESKYVTYEADAKNRPFLNSSPPNLNTLLFAILYRLVKNDDAALVDWKRKMDQLSGLAEEKGFIWLATEAAALSASLSNTSNASQWRDSLIAKCSIKAVVSFSDKIRPPEKWENQLNTLEAVAEKYGRKKNVISTDNNAPKRKELIWHLKLWMKEWEDHDNPGNIALKAKDEDYYDFIYYQPDGRNFYFDLVPIERTYSKTGKPSKGKKISLKRLREEPELIDSLTEQDQGLIKYLKKKNHWRGRAGYYFENRRALLELVDHPLVFLDETATQPVTLEKGRIQVELSEDQSNNVTLRITPPLGHKDVQVKLVQKGPQQFVLYEITNTVRELQKAFSGEASISLPGHAKPRLIDALSTLAAELEISAEGSTEDTLDQSQFRQVDGDPTPRLRLIPHGDGLQATLLVRPLPSSDFNFPPGDGKSAIFGFDNHERIQAKRNLKTEKKLAKTAVQNTPTLALNQGEMISPWEWAFPEPLDCLNLLRELHEWIDSKKPKGKTQLTPPLILEWPEGETLQVSGTLSASSLSLKLTNGTDWLGISGKVQIDKDRVLTMRELLDLASTSRQPGFIEVGTNRFFALTKEFQRQVDHMRSVSQTGKSDEIQFPPLAALALEDFVEEAQPKGKQSQTKAWKDWIQRFRKAREHNPSPPNTLQAELRPYQLDGYRWLSRLAMSGAGACLADDMGLGKTVQTLALLLERAQQGPSLVMAPTSVAANWLDEIIKFAPTLNPIVFGDSNDRKAQLGKLGPRDVVLCTYGLLVREETVLTEIEWNVIVLDEAQAIKNSATQRSKAARKLKGDFRMVTTGTPIENQLSELHTLFQFILPGFLGSWERFRKQFADPIERNQDLDAKRRLADVIRPFLLRRLKSKVLRDLPERTEISLHVQLSEEEQAFYEALRQRALEGLDKDDSGAIQILAELTRLRRACCHPSLVDKNVGKSISSSKLEAFANTLDELMAGNHKVLVFSQFVDHLKLIRKLLDKGNITYQYLDGSTPKAKRKKAVDAFQQGEGEVFLISLKAGGFGLNLTAADYVIHMDPWWNPAAEDQASDRAHRIGQTRPVTIYRFITKGTIEEKIVDLHHRKRELAESLLSDSDDTSTRLNPEELLALIRE